MQERRAIEAMFPHSVFAALCLAFLGCGDGVERVTSSPSAVIEACERPSKLDTSVVGEFTLRFNGEDFLAQPARVDAGSRAEIEGSLLCEPNTLARGDSLTLIAEFRQIADGAADWSTPPCKLSNKLEWSFGPQQGKTGGRVWSKLKATHEVNWERGKYEVRFYGIRTNNLTDDPPAVYWIGASTLTVT